MATDRPSPTEPLTDLGHLGSAVGHHVINAFSAIVSSAEILRLTAQAGTPADPIGLADQIIRSALEASTVARRLIDYTRPITAVGDESVRLEQLAAEVVEAHRPNDSTQIAWVLNLSPVSPIKGHGAQLRAMIRHLIDNAVEALPPAGGTIQIATRVSPEGWLVLEVSDDGEGMTVATQERALEPFFTTRSGSGHLGVGLSIANAIWRRHQGTLSISTRPGAGTSIKASIRPQEARRSDGPLA